MSNIIKLKGTGSITADREVINRNFETVVAGVSDISVIVTSGEVATTSDNVDNKSGVEGSTVTQALNSLNSLLGTISSSSTLLIVDDVADLPATPAAGDLAYVRNISGNPLKLVPALFVYDLVWELISRKDAIIYITDIDDAVVSPGVDTIGASVADMKGMNFSQFIDTYAFPTINAYINSNKSSNLTYSPSTSIVEVGALLTITLNASFNQGSIRNGNGSAGPSLVGLPSSYIFTGPGIASNVTVFSTSTSTSIDTTNAGFAAANALFGSQNWSVIVNHVIGSGTYYDSKQNVASNLDPSRVAGTSSDASPSITGRYKAFYGVASIPVDSAGVRASSNTIFLSASNTGSFTINIPANTAELYFSVPANKTIQVNYVESANANVTGTFTNTVFSVNDAAGVPVAYDTWSSVIGGGGYPSAATYNVIIS